MAHAGGYYGKVFQAFRGVTQGDPLSPSIFNVFMDSVVCNQVSLVAGGAGGTDGWGGGGCFTAPYSSNRTTAGLHPLTLIGSRGRSTPLPVCSKGWGSVPMMVR